MLADLRLVCRVMLIIWLIMLGALLTVAQTSQKKSGNHSPDTFLNTAR